MPDLPEGTPRRRTTVQDHGLEKALDNELIASCRRRARAGAAGALELPIRNVNRTVGTMLGAEVTRRYGGDGLPDGTIDITLPARPASRFGAFLPARHHAAAGRRRQRLPRQGPVRRPARRSARRSSASFVAERNVIAGNVLLYGATGGEVFVRGLVGERFAVRNSGATAVVEGVGDHGCEYMTGGRSSSSGRSGATSRPACPAARRTCSTCTRRGVNREMVDLEALDAEDVDVLRALVQRHVEHTGSAVGAALLADWARERRRFTKVMPRDYKNVLLARSQALEAGFGEDSHETLDAIMEASRG